MNNETEDTDVIVVAVFSLKKKHIFFAYVAVRHLPACHASRHPRHQAAPRCRHARRGLPPHASGCTPAPRPAPGASRPPAPPASAARPPPPPPKPTPLPSPPVPAADHCRAATCHQHKPQPDCKSGRTRRQKRGAPHWRTSGTVNTLENRSEHRLRSRPPAPNQGLLRWPSSATASASAPQTSPPLGPRSRRRRS